MQINKKASISAGLFLLVELAGVERIMFLLFSIAYIQHGNLK
jgi:hypothetical protein